MTTRSTYLDAAAAAVRAVTQATVAQRWDDASALERMTLGELAAHLVRSLGQVSAFLDAPPPAEPGAGEAIRPVPAEEYYGDLHGFDDLDSPLNVGVRDRSADGAAAGPAALAADAAGQLDALRRCLAEPGAGPEAVPADRLLTVFGGRTMAVDEYLRTRLVEFAVHLDDLAASGVPVDVPDGTLDAAVEVLVGVARYRHGDLAVLRALARRERDGAAALRVI